MTNDNIITQEKWNSLHEELWDRRTEMTEMKIGLAKLLRERDEARRLHCHMSAQFMYKSVELDTAKHVANSKGWDCFKEETQ